MSWCRFLGQDGGGVKVYSVEIDHVARVLFNQHPPPVLYSIRHRGRRTTLGFRSRQAGKPSVVPWNALPAGTVGARNSSFSAHRSPLSTLHPS